MSKYEDLDDATRAEVDAAIEIYRSDAQAAHNRELITRLDRLEARIPEPTPVPSPSAPSPVPPPPRNEPNPPVADPPVTDPPVKRKSAWWGDRLNEE